MKRLLLIGGAGFIGSNLIKELQHRGKYDIFVLEQGSQPLVRIENLSIRIYRGSIKDSALVERIITSEKIDTVIHLAATTVPGSSCNEFLRELEEVVFPTFLLIEICSKRDVEFIFFSSGGTIYGERIEIQTPLCETEPLAPISYYGLSKLMIEDSIRFASRVQGLRYLIIRPSNPYGHGQDLNGKQGFIAVAIGNVLAGKPITVWGDGTAVRDYIYIDDLTTAVAGLLTREEAINMTFNIGSGVGCRVNDVIKVLEKVASEPVVVKYMPARKADVSFVILDTQRLRNFIPFEPITVEEGVKKFYDSSKLR